ncbi:MAG: polysaccharide ABC transporter ATP-binding protein [Desulforhabdus sp.]|jgi:lipopolysaccharide transport system ATP-binding protein|nr:polysaccharide ABC transporter ATP-binding protein [Desulforhabdus sp.]
MENMAIQANRLGKRYKVLTGQFRHNTLRDQLAESVKSMCRWNGRRREEEKLVWALKDVSFEVRQGETLGFIGRNGAGKSTLLKLLSRITEPTTGNAKIYGRIASLLEVGVGFHPELTGRENIFLNGIILGMSKREIKRKFDEIVEFAETGIYIDTPVKRYSSGMHVRLAFAVAAHLEPEILVVDEVLAVGDVAFQKKCLGKMGEVAKEGRTVLFVSHNMIAVNSLCSRTIWLNAGGIVQDGPTAEVVTNYLSASTKDTDLFEEIWDDVATAPGNEMVRLHRIRVRPQDDHPSAALTMQMPFQVEVEYWNLEPGAHLRVTLHLYTAERIIAFTTGSANSRPMQAGLIRSVCYFPGNLLNSGHHRIVLLAVKDASSVILRHESRVSLDILDLREREGGWFGREPGVVQPVLKWTTEFLDLN